MTNPAPAQRTRPTRRVAHRSRVAVGVTSVLATLTLGVSMAIGGTSSVAAATSSVGAARVNRATNPGDLGFANSTAPVPSAQSPSPDWGASTGVSNAPAPDTSSQAS